MSGDQGPRGYRGDTGLRGDAGPKGSPGTTGSDGKAGAAGPGGALSPEAIGAVLKSLRHLLIIVIGCFTIAISYTVWQSYTGRQDIINGLRSACERSKMDRVSNAAGWTAHSKYIHSVTQAASVKEDVKRAAREASVVYTRSAADLSSRTGLVCSRVYPHASLLP